MWAPIIINNKSKNARQIVLQDSKLEVRYPMYMELKRSIVQFSSDDSKRTQVSAPQVAKIESNSAANEETTKPAASRNSVSKEL